MAFTGQVYAYNSVEEVLTLNDYGKGETLVSLHTSQYTPNASDEIGDLRGEVKGGNYASVKLRGREIVFDEAVQRIQLNAARVVWPLSTITARWAVLSLAGQLLAWVDFGGIRKTNNAAFIIGWENDRVLEIEGTGESGVGG